MIGLQLYTVRDVISDKQSADATVKRIKEMGYECTQVAGSIEHIELTVNACIENGLKVVGILGHIELCYEDEKRLFAIAEKAQVEDIAISNWKISSEEEVNEYILKVNEFAKKVREKGYTFSYHNHSNEFIRTKNGKTIMQMFLEGFDKEIYLMPDTYWLQHGGMDVRQFIEDYGDRVKILHLKDLKRAKEGPTFAELGIGNINFEGVLQIAKSKGIKHYVVEQDVCENSLESAKISLEYLNKII